MKYFLLITFSIVLVISSCQKKNLIIDSDLDVTYSVNGFLTDTNKLQIITITKNSPIKDFSEPSSVPNANIQIQQNGINYNFIQNDTGAYQSELPFAIINGEEFTVEYEVNTSKLVEKYIAPSPIIIKDLTTVVDSLLKIFIKVESPINQFFTYKIFNFNSDTSAMTSSWDENTTIPPLQLAYTNAGTNNILIIEDNNRFGRDDTGSIVRIELTPISKKVRDYYVKLNTYYETVATYNLYVSAPKFYSNHFYGLTYASSWTSIIGSL